MSAGGVDRPTSQRVRALLERFWVRVVLSLAILASLVPHRHEAVTDLVFLGLFGVELTLRVIALVGARDALGPRRRAAGVLLLLLDVVALLTFVPWVAQAIGDAGWLRLLRFVRLALLFAYWSPLIRSAFEVLGRQDRWRQIALLGLVFLLVAFAGAALLVHIPVPGVDFDGDGAVGDADAGFGARFWWALRQLADNGTLVTDANQAALVAVSLFLTVAGLVFVSFLIGLATDIVKELVVSAGNRAPGWHGHTVIVHATPGLPRLLAELGAYYERLFRRPRFIVADPAAEPPDGMREADLPRYRWRVIDPRGSELADKTDLAAARRVVVLARPEAHFPDAHLAATVLAAREANRRGWIVAEVLDPGNAAATRVAGGPRTVVVASERHLALWALAAVRRPDQLPIAHELVVSRTGREIYTCYLDADGLWLDDDADAPTRRAWQPAGMTFRELVALALEQGGRVMPLGVIVGDAPGGPPEAGELVLNPPADEPLAGRCARSWRWPITSRAYVSCCARSCTASVRRAPGRAGPARAAPARGRARAPQGAGVRLPAGDRRPVRRVARRGRGGRARARAAPRGERARRPPGAARARGRQRAYRPPAPGGAARRRPLRARRRGALRLGARRRLDARAPPAAQHRARRLVERAHAARPRGRRGGRAGRGRRARGTLRPRGAARRAPARVRWAHRHGRAQDRRPGRGRAGALLLELWGGGGRRRRRARAAPARELRARRGPAAARHRHRGAAGAHGVPVDRRARLRRPLRRPHRAAWPGLRALRAGRRERGRTWTFAALAGGLLSRRRVLIAVDRVDGRRVHEADASFTEADIAGVWTLADERVTEVSA